MSELDFSIEPEVEALIREIAKDPRSSFFQVERPRSPRGLIQSWEPYSPSSAGWTAAERHLMSAYREEVAYCLRTRILLETLQLRPLSIFLDHRESLHDPIEVPSREMLQQRTRAAFRAAEQDDYEGSSSAALQRLIDREPLSVEDVYDLALITVRLTPNDTAWLRVALALNLRGDAHGAIHILRARLLTASSDLMQSYMWDNIGVAYSMLNDHAAARDAYRRACESGPLRVPSIASLIYQSLLCGDSSAVHAACVILDERVDPGHPALEDFVSGLGRARAAGLWEPPTEIRDLVRRLESRCGPAARRVLHAAR